MMNVISSRTTAVAAVCAVALSIAALLVFRSRMSPTTPEYVSTLSDLAASHFQSVSSTKINDTIALRSALLAPAPVTAPDVRVDQAIHGSLVTEIMTLLNIRSRANAEEYAAWMRQRGYTLTDLATLPKNRQRLGRYFYLNPEATTSDSWTIFKESFAAELRNGILGNSRPVSVTASTDGIEIQYGVLRGSASFEDAFAPLMADLIQSVNLPENPSAWTWTKEIGRLHWYLGDSYSGVSHWTPPDTLDELLEQHSEILCAKALIVTMNSQNQAIPTMFSFYYDATRGTWNLLYMFYTNTDTVQGGPEF